MKLNWKESSTDSASEADKTRHFAECVENIESHIISAIEQCIDKTMSLLSLNVKDESRYLMFEWDTKNSVLTTVVTDDLKENDSVHVVVCSMPGLNSEMLQIKNTSVEDWESKIEDYSFDVKYRINDYLTTCSEFLRYSLIAAFHNESRDKSILV